MTRSRTRLVADILPAIPPARCALSVTTLDQEVVSDVKPALAALSGAVGFVLLVACANLANLLLARASARSRELAVRVSIGASRELVGQLAVEGLLLGVLGAVGGLLIATWCVDGLLLWRRRRCRGAKSSAWMRPPRCSPSAQRSSAPSPRAWSRRGRRPGRRRWLALKQDPASSRSAMAIRGGWPPVSWRCRSSS